MFVTEHLGTLQLTSLGYVWFEVLTYICRDNRRMMVWPECGPAQTASGPPCSLYAFKLPISNEDNRSSTAIDCVPIYLVQSPDLRFEGHFTKVWLSQPVLCALLTSSFQFSTAVKMPVNSSHQPISIPSVDLWSLLFERSDREYPDNQGLNRHFEHCHKAVLTTWTSPFFRYPIFDSLHIFKCPESITRLWVRAPISLQMAQRWYFGSFYSQQCRYRTCFIWHPLGGRCRLPIQ